MPVGVFMLDGHVSSRLDSIGSKERTFPYELVDVLQECCGTFDVCKGSRRVFRYFRRDLRGTFVRRVE